MSETNELVVCDIPEIFYLVGLLRSNAAYGILDLTVGQTEEEPAVIVSERYTRIDVKYIERETESDLVVLESKDVKVNFEVGTSKFAKQISEDQIFLTMWDEKQGIKVRFESEALAIETADEARNYTPPKDGLYIHDLPEGGCMVMFQGETSIFSAEEVEEMKRDYLLAKHKERMEKQR